MKTAILLLALSLLSTQAYAEWTKVRPQTRDEATLYVDYSSARRLGNTVTVWALIDYKTTALSGSSSSEIKLEFDCLKALRRFAAYMTFEGHMAQGSRMFLETPSQLAREPWLPVPEGSAAHRIMIQVCSNI